MPKDGERYFILGQDKAHIVADAPQPSGLTMCVTLAHDEKVSVPAGDINYCFKGLEGFKNDGAYDDLLTEMADFFKEHKDTKFFLRTCYEFNGDAGSWSHVNFRETFKYVRKHLEKKAVNNVAYVWQSDAYHSTGRNTQALAIRRKALAGQTLLGLGWLLTISLRCRRRSQHC